MSSTLELLSEAILCASFEVIEFCSVDWLRLLTDRSGLLYFLKVTDDPRRVGLKNSPMSGTKIASVLKLASTKRIFKFNFHRSVSHCANRLDADLLVY